MTPLAAATAYIGLQTTIGWPNFYWQNGLPAFLGAIAMYVLVGVAMCLMFATRRRERGGPMFMTLGLLLTACLLLQVMPGSSTGVRFLPGSPSAYSNWLASAGCIVCWLGLAVASFCLVSRCGDAPQVFSAVMLFTLTLNAGLSFCHVADSDCSDWVASSPQNEFDDGPYRHQIEKWKERSASIQDTLARLLTDRQDVVERLNRLGVRSTSDLRANPSGREVAGDLRELVGQISALQSDLQHLDRAIIVMESKIRRTARLQALRVAGGITEEEREQLRLKELELGEVVRERLSHPSVISDLELDAVLDKTLSP